MTKPQRKNKYPGSPSPTRNPDIKPRPKALPLRVKEKENKPTVKKRQAINRRTPAAALQAARGRLAPGAPSLSKALLPAVLGQRSDPAPKSPRHILHTVSSSSQALLRLVCASLRASKPPVPKFSLF